MVTARPHLAQRCLRTQPYRYRQLHRQDTAPPRLSRAITIAAAAAVVVAVAGSERAQQPVAASLHICLLLDEPHPYTVSQTERQTDRLSPSAVSDDTAVRYSYYW